MVMDDLAGLEIREEVRHDGVNSTDLWGKLSPKAPGSGGFSGFVPHLGPSLCDSFSL